MNKMFEVISGRMLSMRATAGGKSSMASVPRTIVEPPWLAVGSDGQRKPLQQEAYGPLRPDARNTISGGMLSMRATAGGKSSMASVPRSIVEPP